MLDGKFLSFGTNKNEKSRTINNFVRQLKYHWQQPACVCVSPSEAASSALSGRARYRVR